eukprot:TRINITY_DN57624_c0_g1_i1.p1 TRINITY_DN57624_c0_g1~~TRINITY_DN57624_c0_g1_i1.p1  ORF type:complete len:199 (-),score=37.06 TRINITY_DN57624_c0_g1_i1:24-620(-)
MMLECNEKGHKAIIHAGATSALGRMMIVTAKQHNITLINICRRQENVELLKSVGAEIVLDQTAEDFAAQLKATIEQHQPSAFFDPVSGPLGSQVFAALPNGATAYCYGALDMAPYQIGQGDLIFKNKTFRGFWLTQEIMKPGVMEKVAGAMLKNLATNQYSTTIQKTFPNTEYESAFQLYKTSATKGKVLITNPEFTE